jgi:hypothetical protein
MNKTIKIELTPNELDMVIFMMGDSRWEVLAYVKEPQVRRYAAEREVEYLNLWKKLAMALYGRKHFDSPFVKDKAVWDEAEKYERIIKKRIKK